ncbi:signal peptidase I [Rhodococcus oryzae]|uniref:signal peptidase I n=1 Tax=Rhodococcus oryzae TaxID=2571143 RepID=UPI0037105AAE
MDSTSSRSGRDIALNVGAIAGLICVLAAAASFFFGIKPLIFRSGSMSPEISTGALALSKPVPASELSVGDIVSVENEQGTRITHRVHEIVSADSDSSVLILKGDANQDADISPYTVTEADRVFFSLPGLGYVVAWLSSPIAIFLGGAFVGGLMVIAFRPTSGRKGDDDGDAGTSGTPAEQDEAASEEAKVVSQPSTDAHAGTDAPTQRFAVPARSLMALGAASLAVLGMTQVAGTSAAWTKTSAATSSFGSAADFLPAPKWLGCESNGTWVRMKWEHLGPGYTYDIKLYDAWGGSWNPTIPPNKGDQVYIDVNGYNNVYETASSSHIEVKAVRNGQVGTGWVGENIWAYTLWNIKCDGKVSSGSQALMAPGGAEAMMARAAAPETTTTAPSTTTAAPTTTTTAPSTTASTTTTTASTTTTTAPTTTTTAPSTTTTTAPTTTTTASTTTTAAPTTTAAAPTTTTTEPPAAAEAAVAQEPSPTLGGLTLSNPSPSGTYKAGVSGSNAVVTDAAGAQVFSTPAGANAMVKWQDGTDRLWIIDAGALYVVDGSSGWTKTKVDPKTGDVPAAIAELVK